MKISTRKLVITALGLALAIVLPFLTGQIPQIGSMLLPMHIPVLLIGFICGWPYGLILGLISAPLRSLIFTMPPMFPVALAMAFEMAAYGAIAGFLYRKLPKNTLNVYISLIASMICGRIVWAIASYVIFAAAGNSFTIQLFLAGAFVNALPGIILQIVLIPVLVLALRKANIIKD
ncbi:MAG TPA: ECF transporter S component [Clostridia bacterium]|nr:ECF transporter S component [Clostridia bacterium]HQM96753.1 ECF transporter S component [Clostridia bacterium]